MGGCTHHAYTTTMQSRVLFGLLLCIGLSLASSQEVDAMVPEQTFPIHTNEVSEVWDPVSAELLQLGTEQSLMSIDDMMDESEANAKAEYAKLKKQKPAEKAKWDKAKRDFRNCRK